VSINWKNHLLTDATIKSLSGGMCKIRTDMPVKIENATATSLADANGYVISVNTEKGKSYHIMALKN
jgi:alpha-L-fucosidase 2